MIGFEGVLFVFFVWKFFFSRFDSCTRALEGRPRGHGKRRAGGAMAVVDLTDSPEPRASALRRRMNYSFLKMNNFWNFGKFWKWCARFGTISSNCDMLIIPCIFWEMSRNSDNLLWKVMENAEIWKMNIDFEKIKWIFAEILKLERCKSM